MEFTYPIAENFESVQGEGQNCGVAMTFIRLAGCNVGKPVMLDEVSLLKKEASYQEVCTSWDGTQFLCDTNYSLGFGKPRFTADQIGDLLEVQLATWVSITGGEPFIHDVARLSRRLVGARKMVHVETSGTKPIHGDFHHIVVSPKSGCLRDSLYRADEIRLLVGKTFDEQRFLEEFPEILRRKVWLSPVNNLATLDFDNVKRCLELQQKYRELRLTTQMHKIWGVR